MTNENPAVSATATLYVTSALSGPSTSLCPIFNTVTGVVFLKDTTERLVLLLGRKHLSVHIQCSCRTALRSGTSARECVRVCDYVKIKLNLICVMRRALTDSTLAII